MKTDVGNTLSWVPHKGLIAAIVICVNFHSSQVNGHNWLQSSVWALSFLVFGFGYKSFFWIVLSALPQPPSIPKEPCFSVRVHLPYLRGPTSILKRLELALRLCMTWPYTGCPGTMEWTCMRKAW
jgi:hypothetical protein